MLNECHNNSNKNHILSITQKNGNNIENLSIKYYAYKIKPWYTLEKESKVKKLIYEQNITNKA